MVGAQRTGGRRRRACACTCAGGRVLARRLRHSLRLERGSYAGSMYATGGHAGAQAGVQPPEALGELLVSIVAEKRAGVAAEGRAASRPASGVHLGPAASSHLVRGVATPRATAEYEHEPEGGYSNGGSGCGCGLAQYGGYGGGSAPPLRK